MISVLMATYNGELFIEEQLESIRIQTQAADEVIICDDCSQDGTLAAVQAYIERQGLDHWRLLQNEQNLGHYQTFLKLVSSATGDCLFFSDQDDVWEADKIAVLMDQLERPEVSMVYANSHMIDEQGQLITSGQSSGQVEEIGLLYLLKAWPSGYQTAYKRQVLEDILEQGYPALPGFDYHDVLFGMLAAFYGRVSHVDRALDSHRIHANNATLSAASRSLSKDRQSRLAYLEKVLQRYQSLLSIAEERELTAARTEVQQMVRFTEDRLALLSKPKISLCGRLFRKRKYYKSSKDYISDLLYAYSLQTLIRRLADLFGK